MTADPITIEPHPERPGVYELKTELWLPLPIQTVFDFFADAQNLEAITPDWLRFRIVTPRPIAMSAGILIDYRLRLHGIPIGWRTEISEWSPPHRFVDRQLRGPYRLWVHEHTFEEHDGGTRIRDAVTHAVPGGALVHRFFVRPDLLAIFRFRQEAIQRLLLAEAPRAHA